MIPNGEYTMCDLNEEGREERRRVRRERWGEEHLHFPPNQWHSRAFSRGLGRCRAWHVFSVTTCPARIMRNRLRDEKATQAVPLYFVKGASISWGTKILLENDVIICNSRSTGHVIFSKSRAPNYLPAVDKVSEGLFQTFLGLSGKYQLDATTYYRVCVKKSKCLW